MGTSVRFFMCSSSVLVAEEEAEEDEDSHRDRLGKRFRWHVSHGGEEKGRW